MVLFYWPVPYGKRVLPSFVDGSSLSFAEVVRQSQTGTAGADYLFGYEEDNTFDGGEGNKSL